MIKFKNLKKACEKLECKLESTRLYISVFDKNGYRLMYFYPDKVWEINFKDDFNFSDTTVKAKLIKAITKDYEDYINED